MCSAVQEVSIAESALSCLRPIPFNFKQTVTENNSRSVEDVWRDHLVLQSTEKAFDFLLKAVKELWKLHEHSSNEIPWNPNGFIKDMKIERFGEPMIAS